MASSVNVSIEQLDECHVQEISYDGTEIVTQPLSMSEHLANLAQKIDFTNQSRRQSGASKISDVDEIATSDTSAEKDEKDQLLAPYQQSLWPWDSVRTKLRNALTEMSVLLDVISITRGKRYLILDPVSSQQVEQTTIKSALLSKKRGLQSSANMLFKAAERLRSAQSDASQNRLTDFHAELLKMRKKWRLQQACNQILGNLSYSNDGSRDLARRIDGNFLVERQELFDKITQRKQSPIRVNVSSMLKGVSYIQVRIEKACDANTIEELCSFTLHPEASDIGWQQMLENAQYKNFCIEIMSELLNESIRQQLPIPMTNSIHDPICIPLFPDTQLVIWLHSGELNEPEDADTVTTASNCEQITISGNCINEDIKRRLSQNKHSYVLEHSLHQLLREKHYQALHHPMPHPVTASLCITMKHYLAGPDAIDKQTLIESSKPQSMLERIIAQAQHAALRQQTMRVLDQLALSVCDPIIISHWLTLNSLTQSTVRVTIVSPCYENLCRTPIILQLSTRSIKVICRDGRKLELSYEPKELEHVLRSQISNHQTFAIQQLSRMMGWKVLNYTPNAAIEADIEFGTSSSITTCSPNAQWQLLIRHGQSTDTQVTITRLGSDDEGDSDNNPLLQDTQWKLNFCSSRTVSIKQLVGKNFVGKIEYLMASLMTLK